MRRFILSFLRHSGLLHLWRYWHRHSVTIVMIHGVMDEGIGGMWTPMRPQLSRARLDAYLAALGRHYQFVSMDDAAAMLEGRAPIRPYSLVVTLDDGYRNQVRHAAPILARHGAPHVVYVVPRHIDERRPFWFDRLDFALQHANMDGRLVTIGPVQVRFRARDRASLAASFKELRRRAKAQCMDDAQMRTELERLAETLERESGCSLQEVFEQDDWSCVLAWEDIEGDSSPLTTIGSHTMDHVQVTNVPPATLEYQLAASKASIERHRGACHHLCYPYGSSNDLAAEQARRTGYRTAVTDTEGLNARGIDLMRLRRINMDGDHSDAEMLARVSGLLQAVSTLRLSIGSLLRGSRQTIPVAAKKAAV